MAISVEREDLPESFVTILRFINGNETQEIQVYKWEANAIESKVKGLSAAQVLAHYNAGI